MNKLFLSTAVLTLILTATSCKKDDVETSKGNIDDIFGKWTMVEFAVDANTNNQVDPEEIQVLNYTLHKRPTITFNKDSTANFFFDNFGITEEYTTRFSYNYDTKILSDNSSAGFMNHKITTLTGNKLV